MIKEDLRTELLAEASISAIIGTRMFLEKPIETQTSAYLEYNRNSKGRDIVSETNVFKIFAFSKSAVKLETLTTNVINFLEGKTHLNGNFYFSISFKNQTDSNEKLEDGFLWSLLTFTFKHTT